MNGSILKNSESTKRNLNIDIIKAIAASFVIVLHLDGTIMPAIGIENASMGVKITYYLIESICYIAVHLFVLAGSYLMYEKLTTSLKSLMRIYFTTLLVTVIGFVIALCAGVHVHVLQVGQSFFPISLRAYGYVSSYMFLMIISPFLKIALQKMTDKQVYYITSVLFIVNIVFPTFIPFIGWGENYTILFVLLYLVAVSIYRFNDGNSSRTKAKWGGTCVWIAAVFLLTISPFIISYLSKIITFFAGKEGYFYNYQNVLVLTAAVAFFVMVSNIQISNNIFTSVITSASNATLVIYIYHMHPVFKRIYSDWDFFKGLYSDHWYIYLATILTSTVVIYIVGMGVSRVINIPLNWLMKYIDIRIKKSERIKKILLDCKVSV